MKEIFKKIIILILTLESKAVLLRFKPKIIAITGNVGKTSTKDAIYTALSNNLKIRKNQKSFNSEIGTPLTILGLDNAWNNPVLWLKNIFLGALVPFKKKYPEWLVLEIGVDRPGDIPKVAKWLKPDVVVITSLPKVPVHVEYFSSPEAVIKEKLSLIDYLKPNGILILSSDDPLVLAVKDKAKHVVYTYGSESSSTVSFSNKSIVYEDYEGTKLPIGMTFKLSNAGNSVPILLPNVLGVQHALPVAAAIAVGLSQNVPFLDMVNSFSDFQPPRGRMNLILGKNKSIVIDDTYNASPLAMQKAVEVLSEIETNGSKIAVLGDMLEIGNFTVAEHKKIGEQIAKSKIDLLISVGIRAKTICESALENGMNDKSIFHFKDYKGVSDLILSNLKPGDVVLVKGSQGVRLEKVVSDIISEDLDKMDLLVRQEKDWQDR
jgi:UDP-N-acetylmuramoyl-tripeptide--D-alanyl-D-alanine ligase